MNISIFAVRPIQENTYIYFDRKTREGVIIDPGGDSGRLIRFINENDLNITTILLTHGHFDHILAVDVLRKSLGARVAAHVEELTILNDGNLNMSYSMNMRFVTVKPDILFKDMDEFDFGPDKLRVLHTPGHSKGSVCYYSPKNKVLFSGDTLFCESVGRTDLPEGNSNDLFESIEKKLFILPTDVIVYPGHGQATSIGHERNNNPYFNEEGIY